MRATILALTCGFALSGCATSPSVTPTLDQLLATIDRRLDLAEAVALHKWDHQQPVQASVREQQVLLGARQAAVAHHLDPARVEAFFADQIEANKLLQYHLLDTWHRARKAPALPRRDLASEVRPELDLLQEQLLSALARFDQTPPDNCANHLADALQQRTQDTTRHLALVRASAQLCKLR
ncbi:chorismate mutase [Pseudomonas sp. 250J]|uniref:chorismate mutase n=1 Tax=Pseudomonas peradeniyensis TaxID=2745488 RepID=A0ABT2VAL3_9PSED|nr:MULTISPECIES: gamma subclass chorismate mutase AroQ [Pseudomonas]KNX75976.1 chorismate mutase [Pseudomonas sp. 250J]MCU7238563.1 gamma subclass chorismate mutase AroQ [Pseudomonas peradeniyensis]MCU7279032.1 gamma subclass chorismate mutase AroQ [Pseudomonas peradeniyensis]QZA54115.1 gamma subclass chorismate mutase AroQ [Pseudomonas sp. 2hn]